METREDGVSAKIAIYAFLTLLLVFAIAYFDSLAVLFKIWVGRGDTSYRYGFLVFACALYLIYLKKDRFRFSEFSPNYWALLPTIAFSLGWFVASLANVQTVQLAVIPFLLLAAAMAVLGHSVVKPAFLPIIVLLFAMPLWWPLTPYLRDATTVVTEFGLRVIDKPVFVQGYYLHLPGGTFFIDDGCAGLRFFIVTLTLCFISIDMFVLSLRQSLILLGVGAALALLANWVRVMIVVLVGDYTQMEHRLVRDHYDLGWVVFGVLVILPVFLMIHYFNKPAAIDVEELTIEPTHSSSISKNPKTSKPFITAATITCLILITAPVASLVLENTEFPDRPIATLVLADPWHRTEEPPRSSTLLWQPNFVDYTDQLHSQYTDGADLVNLHVINYAHQREGGELFNVDNQMANGDTWSIIPNSQHKIIIEVEGGMAVGVNTLQVSSRPTERSLVWYWYEVGSNRTNNNYNARLYELLSLLGLREDASLVSLSVECSSICLDDGFVLQQFLSQNYLAIRENL